MVLFFCEETLCSKRVWHENIFFFKFFSCCTFIRVYLFDMLYQTDQPVYTALTYSTKLINQSTQLWHTLPNLSKSLHSFDILYQSYQPVYTALTYSTKLLNHSTQSWHTPPNSSTGQHRFFSESTINTLYIIRKLEFVSNFSLFICTRFNPLSKTLALTSLTTQFLLMLNSNVDATQHYHSPTSTENQSLPLAPISRLAFVSTVHEN